MKKYYEITAEYRVKKSLHVLVKDGADPKDPANWENIGYEHDIDCSLYEVESAKEAE